MTRTAHRRTRSKVVLAMLASAAMLGGVVGGVAIASHSSTHVLYSGKTQVSEYIATESQPSVYSSPSWQAVSGSSRTVSVPSGSTRLLVANFTAESVCDGTSGNWCSVRIVARKSGSTTKYEFYPRVVGPDYFGFDSPDGGGSMTDWESHAISRARSFPSGTWYVSVEASVVGSGTSLRLANWFFSVRSLTR